MNDRTEYSKIWESYHVGRPVDTWEEGQEPKMTWTQYVDTLSQVLREAEVNLSELQLLTEAPVRDPKTGRFMAAPAPGADPAAAAADPAAAAADPAAAAADPAAAPAGGVDPAALDDLVAKLAEITQAIEAIKATAAGGDPAAAGGPQQPGLLGKIGGAIAGGARKVGQAAVQGVKDVAAGAKAGYAAAAPPPAA